MSAKNTIAAAPMDDYYQAESDFHTLSRAEEIKGDAKRHQKAMNHGKQKVAAMQAVVGEGASDKETGGMKEGSKAEEAQDAKQARAANGRPLPQRGMRAMGATKRPAKVNRSSVI